MYSCSKDKTTDSEQGQQFLVTLAFRDTEMNCCKLFIQPSLHFSYSIWHTTCNQGLENVGFFNENIYFWIIFLSNSELEDWVIFQHGIVEINRNMTCWVENDGVYWH